MSTESALRELYSRITQIAHGLGGTVTEPPGGASLHVWLSSGLSVVFTPAYPLIGDAFPVNAVRIHNGDRKSDLRFIYEHGFWTSEADGNNALSDNQIRACLTPEGPPTPSS